MLKWPLDPDSEQVRELFVARAALERDYAAKLQLLTKKAIEKKTRMESSLVIGEHPTKTWEASTLMQNRASDDRHADRAAKQAEQQRNDMLNSKK
ncbi:hypothetical protein DXG03_007450 [Asterophora parasitica]|uniref:FCH domain-containing protein n=1 Tax=Asterophora parasitica TaxID=117018 RepID=A0A9P7GA05_9AGAR|nr:hypothetical protein DXG03_007450 [Asterophora parasitica]